jgi:hypothetical protein
LTILARRRYIFNSIKSAQKIVMKKFQALFFPVVCGVFFSLAVPALAQTAESGFATVVRVEGVASYSLGDDHWVPLVAGKYLPEGAVIRTGHNGVVDVVLGKDINLPKSAVQSQWLPSNPSPAPDAPVRGMVSYQPAAEQNVVRLTPNTTLGINKLTVTDTGADTVSDTELDLKKGKIFASVKKLTGASQYLIKLPNGIAGVRGTQFSIDADGKVSVYHSTGGGVVLSLILPGGVPRTTVVGSGFNYDPATNQLTILPGDEQTFLERLFAALQTVYSPVQFVSIDSTCIYISPVHGVHDGRHHHGSGQPE